MSDAKLNQIRALLAKAEATDFPAERDAYMQKVTELVARYGIDQALLTAERKERETVGVREIVIQGAYYRDKHTFLHGIALVLNCRTFGYQKADHVVVKIFGYESDLDRVEILYTSLLVQALRGMQNEAPRGSSGRGTMANRRAWLVGFQSVVCQRLAAAEVRAGRQAEEENPGMSTALVLRDRKQVVKDEYDTFLAGLKANGGRVRKSKSSYSGRGFGSGQAAGRRADIGHGRVGGTKTAIGG